MVDEEKQTFGEWIKAPVGKLTSDGEKAKLSLLDAAEKHMKKAMKDREKRKYIPWLYVYFFRASTAKITHIDPKQQCNALESFYI